MLQLETRIAPYVADFARPRQESLSVIAYRSRATSECPPAALQQLLEESRTRNRRAGLTGMLLYEHGSFFQWLEGPVEDLQRVWLCIARDRRHHQIKILQEGPISERLFEGWDLRMAPGAQVSIDATVAAMESSTAQLKRFAATPKFAGDMSLEDVFANIVIPRLMEVHSQNLRNPAPLSSTPSIWHADEGSGEKLASVLISARPAETSDFVDALIDRGASLKALYKEVFEPAQLQLGRLWDQDLCDDFHLTIGLSRLQMELWRVNAVFPAEHLRKSMHSVLLATQLNEPDRLGLLMASELFERGGWDVKRQASGNDQALNEVLRTQWFDVLKLSQSGALRRDSRLESIRVTIDGARAASINPALLVMVDGRTFAERPQMYKAVHANAMCASALDAVPSAERLLDLNRSVTPLCSPLSS